jgi:hypothetical protein
MTTLELNALVAEILASVAIECKAFRSLVGLRSAREFASTIEYLRSSKPGLEGWLVTTSGFTYNAAKALKQYGLVGLTLQELTQKFQTTVQPTAKRLEMWTTRIEEERRKQQRIFVVMPFSDDMLDVFILGIRWAASELGVIAERADDLEHNGEIIEEIREAIRGYDAVVGDTSGANPNVCYEIGYAHALDKPTILICRKGEKLPFDLQGTNHVIYPNILSLREPLKERLRQALRLDSPR